MAEECQYYHYNLQLQVNSLHNKPAEFERDRFDSAGLSGCFHKTYNTSISNLIGAKSFCQSAYGICTCAGAYSGRWMGVHFERLY